MATVTKLSFKKRRRGLVFAELLRCAASAAPDEGLRIEVLRFAGSVERRYGLSPAEKKAAVLETIRDGAQTIIDLTTETGLRPQEVDEIVTLLEAEGRIRTDRLSIHGTGRPSRILIPIEIKS